MSKTIIRISNTSLSNSACILKWYRQVVEGYKNKATGVAMVYGTAVHKFIDQMYEHNGVYPKAFAVAKELYLHIPQEADDKKPWLSDLKHLETTCYNVWSQYIEEDSFEVYRIGGKAAVELTFDFIYYEDDYVQIRLCGTIDSIGEIKGGIPCIRDWKTTASWDNKGYLSQYQLSKQLRLYTLALKIMAQREPESVFGKLGSQRLGAFIDAIFLSSKANDVKFQRSDVFQYSDKDLNEFGLMLDDQCRRLASAVRTGYLPKEGIINDTCSGKYGKKCIFWNVCRVNDDVAKLLLARDFIQKPFDPLAYNV